MGAIFNRLNGAQSTLSVFNSSLDSAPAVNDISLIWASDDLSLTVDTISELWPGSNNKQIAITLPNSASSGTISLSSAQIEVTDLTHPIIFTSGVKMPSGGSVLVSLSHSGSNGINTVETTQIFQGSTSVVNALGVLNPQWNIVRSAPILPISNDETTSISINITFLPADPSETIYFTLPVLCQNFEFVVNNSIFAQVMKNMPEVFRLIDVEQTGDLELPFFRLVDVFTTSLDIAFRQLGFYLYLDVEGGFKENDDTTKSYLVNPDVADFVTLLWLCKFAGNRPITRYETSLDTITTPFELGDGSGSGSNLDTDDGLVLTSYTELNPPPVTLSSQTELLKWQINNSYYGHNAGTLPAVISAAKRQLIGEQSVVVNYDFDTEPWVINLETEWYETYGSLGVEVVGQSSPLILEAIRYARPLGIKITHTMTDN